MAHAFDLSGTAVDGHVAGPGRMHLMEAEYGDACDVMGAGRGLPEPPEMMIPGKLVRRN